MAVAVETGSAPRTAPPLSLPLASLCGTLYLVVALIILLFALPQLWSHYVTPRIGDRIVEWALWVPTLGGAIAALVTLGRRILRWRAPHGLAGGVLLMSTGLLLFFQTWRWLSLYLNDLPGMVVSAAIALGLIYFAVRFYTGSTAARWAVALEEQGWFSTATYKATLGKRLRRLTALGIGAVGLTGVNALWMQGAIPEHGTIELPFEWGVVTLVPHARTTILLVLALLTFWVAWRTIHIPTFAEFLIATEAEMNKVAWPTRRQLAQDTVVVLVTTLLLAIFLLIVDLFWGWLLSREIVGVLPSATQTPESTGPVERVRW